MKWPSLNTQILLGAVFGVAVGFYFHAEFIYLKHFI